MKKKQNKQQAYIPLQTQLTEIRNEIEAAWHLTDEHQKTTVSEIITKTYKLFNQIKDKRSQQHAPLLQQCALIGAACPAIDDIKTFERAFKMQIDYLSNSAADNRRLMRACTEMRDRFLQKIPNLNKMSRPGYLSDVFDNDLETSELFVIHSQEPSDPEHHIRTVFHPVADKRQVSFLDLQNKVEPLKNKINQKKNISKDKWRELFQHLYAYTSGLKQEYRLEETVIDSVEHPVKVALDYMIDLQNTLISYIKTYETLPFIWLESALKRKAVLLKTLSNYYQKTTEAISQTEKDRVSNECARVEAETFDIKNILVWEWIIASENTSPDEKQRAYIAKQQQLDLQCIPVPEKPSEGGIFAYYETLKTHFYELTNSAYSLSFVPLCNQLTIYVQECFITCLNDPSLHIFHLDSSGFDNDDFELSPESCAAIFENRTQLWSILSFYYTVSMKNNEQIMRHHLTADNLAFKNFMRERSFITNTRFDWYRCVFEDDTGSLEERYTKFCYLYEERYYAPPVLRDLAKMRLESLKKIIQDQALSEKDENLSPSELTTEITHQTHHNSIKQKSKKSLKKEQKEQKKRNLQQKNAEEEQLLKESRVYAEKQLIFRPTWSTCRTEIIAHLKKKDFEAALTRINNALNDDSLLDDKETCDALILKVAILKERGCPDSNELSDLINAAWEKLASKETATLLHYMQQETLTHYRHEIYLMNNNSLETVSSSVCQQIAENAGTFCFPLLFSDLGRLSYNDAIQTYQEPVKRLLDTDTQFLVNEYFVDELFMFFTKLSRCYYELGKLLWLEYQRNHFLGSQTERLKANESHTYYFTQSILILERLIDYAKYYQPESLFDLTLSLMNLHKLIADFTEFKDARQHQRKANDLIRQALQSLPKDIDEDKVSQIESSLSNYFNKSNASNQQTINNNINYVSMLNDINHQMKQPDRLKPEASITDLEKIFEKEIQLRVWDTHICLAIKVINSFHPDLRNQANERIFNDCLGRLYEKSTVSLAIVYTDYLNKINQLQKTPCNNPSAPHDALIHEHNAHLHQFLLVKSIRDLINVRKKLDMRTTGTESNPKNNELYDAVYMKLNKLITQIKAFPQQNETVHLLTIPECHQIQMEKVTIKNPDFVKDINYKNIIPVELNNILGSLVENKRDQKNAFKAAEMMFWTLETIQIRLDPYINSINSNEAKQFLIFLLPHYKEIAQSFYQIASNSKLGFFSSNDQMQSYIRDRKKALKAITLTSPTPQILNEEDQKQSATDTLSSFGSLRL